MKRKREKKSSIHGLAMAEADWSQLDTNLLSLISQRFDNDLDLIRFRSVCSMWRHSSISNHHHPSLVLPLKLRHFDLNFRYSCSLSKHILLLIKPPPPQHQQQNLRPWLIRITKNSHDETQFFHPLRPRDSPSPYDFPHVLDFNKFSHVVHLGTYFFLEEELTRLQLSMELFEEALEFHLMNLQDEAFMHAIEKKAIEKKARAKKVVAVTCHGKNPLAFGTLSVEGHPVLYHCREERWTPIPCVSTYFQDICVFKDRFCAVNKIGRIVAFGPDYSVELLAEYVDGGDMKFLVESEGELLLVDIYVSHRFGFPDEDGLRLDVFTLDEKEKKWVKLARLGDRVLFLGNGYSFSATASDLSVVKGNCVIFIDDAFHHINDMKCGMFVFHLDQRRLSPLSDYPDYFNLFWPPPEWIIKSCIREKIKREEEKERGHETDTTSGLLAKLGNMQS